MEPKCPECGSDDVLQDSVDIGVGIQYGPLSCAACGYDESRGSGEIVFDDGDGVL